MLQVVCVILRVHLVCTLAHIQCIKPRVHDRYGLAFEVSRLAVNPVSPVCCRGNENVESQKTLVYLIKRFSSFVSHLSLKQLFIYQLISLGGRQGYVMH